MFGYIKPLKCELKIKEWDYYQAAYCGLCHVLKRRCGFFARFVINYDFTALAVLLSAINPEARKTEFCKRRCIAHPFKKRCIIPSGDSYSKAADTSIIFMWWKLSDDIEDRSFFSSLNARMATFFLKSAYKRAKDREPEFDKHVRSGLNKLLEIEHERAPKLDLPADTFARILLWLTLDIEDDSIQRPMAQIFYHIGRFIYLIDAWDDFDDDIKTGNYNPIAERFGVKSAIPPQVKDELETCLLNDIHAADVAFELLDTGFLHGLIKNIITFGMPNILNRVKSGIKSQLRSGRNGY